MSPSSGILLGPTHGARHYLRTIGSGLTEHFLYIYTRHIYIEYRWCGTLLATEEHKTIPAYIELLCHCCNNATQYHPVPCRMLLMKASFLLLFFAVPPAECHGIAFIIVTINAKHKGGMQDHRNAKHHTSKNMICRAKY